jgi:hypothetical protein
MAPQVGTLNAWALALCIIAFLIASSWPAAAWRVIEGRAGAIVSDPTASPLVGSEDGIQGFSSRDV